jgi:flagellar hook-associated protein 2
MGLALSGLASGFDWKSIVDQLIEVSRAPQNRMRTEKSQLSAKNTALNDIKGLVSSFKSSLTSLNSAEGFQKKSAAFANSTTTWSATADTDAPSGTYEFNFVSKATASKLTGAAGIATQLNPATTLANLPVGRTITGGTFTVDGVLIHNGVPGDVPIPFTSADSLDRVLERITTHTGGSVTASYNSLTDKIDLVKGAGGSISLGASNDTSNFLQAMRLSSSVTNIAASSATLSSPKLSGSIDSANLSGWAGSSVQDSITINGTPIDYNSATDSLQSLINRINSSTAGVTATYDFSAGKFLLTNKTTGNVGITVTDGMGAGGLAAAMGLTTGTLAFGEDAKFTVNGGGEITSRSNTLDESAHGITGLSVTANSIGTETVTVSGDAASTKAALNTFIEKYNAVQNAIDKYTKVTVDGTKVTSSVLSGSRELASISRELRRMLYATGKDQNGAELSGTVKRLSDLGVNFAGIENTISITNSALLDTRLASNTDDLVDYFTTDTEGLVDRLDAMMDRLVNDSSTTPGTFKVQTDSISSQNKSLDKQIAEFERRLDSQRSLLESSFIAMERAQSSFQQQSSYLAKTFSGNSK